MYIFNKTNRKEINQSSVFIRPYNLIEKTNLFSKFWQNLGVSKLAFVMFFSVMLSTKAYAGDTICTGQLSLPNTAAHVDFGAPGIDWGVEDYSNTYNFAATGTRKASTVDITISPNPYPGYNPAGSFIGFGINETSTYTENGDRGVFMVTDGMGTSSTNLNIDLSANPTSFVDMCWYHINWQGRGGDALSITATTDLGTTLNPIFNRPANSDYAIVNATTADSTANASGIGFLGVRFEAPAGEDITAVNGVWFEGSNSTTTNFHGIGWGRIAYDSPYRVDLEITKTVNEATPSVGDTVTFNLEVENKGPSNATDVSVTDIVPEGFTYVANSMTGIAPSVAGITANQNNPTTTGLAWTIAALGNGASATLTFEAVVKAP